MANATIIPRPYIILIDDDVKEDQPLVGYLQQEYGKENVFLFQQPNDGINFIESNLAHRMIVLLDIMFYGKPIGFEIFNQILLKSTLVCFIVMTGNIEQTSRQDLVSLINGHAWHLVQRDKKAKDILGFVKQAEHELSLRVDGALEEWILRQSVEDQDKPFLTNRAGQSYTLTDILNSIRTGGDDIGNRMVLSVLRTAMDILKRDKSRIG